MNLYFPFLRRPDDSPPLSEEEWAPIAAALRELPARPAPRDFRLTAEQAARLRPRSWRERLAVPAPLATGLLAILVLVVITPSLLGSSGAAAPNGDSVRVFTSTERGDALSSDAAGFSPQPATSGPKAMDDCYSSPPTANTAASPSPSPSAPEGSAVSTPIPACDPGY